jgi:hypothetical protein
MKDVMKFSVFLIFFTSCTFYACKPDNCFYGTGSTEKVKVETGLFHTLRIGAMYNIILVQDTTYFIEYSGGQTVLEYVQTHISDSVLSLNYSNSCFFIRDYDKIECIIHFVGLQKIEVGEACSIKSLNTITSDLYLIVSSPMAEVDIHIDNQSLFFYTHHSTGGIYTFSGKTDRSGLLGYHTSKIDASKLDSRETYIENHSIADYYVSAREKLTVGIFNKGNVFYYGSPEIILDSINGSGRVIPVIEK